MLIFPQSWRTAHAVASLMTTGAILMTAGFPVRPFSRSRAGVSLLR